MRGSDAGLAGDPAASGERRTDGPPVGAPPQAWRRAADGVAFRVRAHRFLAVAGLVARIYGGYKLIQASARLRAPGVERATRHHRRSAEGAYRLATRLEGLPIKVGQFLGSRANIPETPRGRVERISGRGRAMPRAFPAACVV